MSDSVLRTDLIPEELTKERKPIVIQDQWPQIISSFQKFPSNLRGPSAAASLVKTQDLIRLAIKDMERREETTNDRQIYYTEEEPDFTVSDKVTICYSVDKSVPGILGKGQPFGDGVKNLVPMLVSEDDDPKIPGYKIATLVSFFDNIVRLTIYARTNKEANRRVDWLINIMVEYAWYFKAHGNDRLFFRSREADLVIEENGEKLYARPLLFFIRTQKLYQLRQKELEQIIVKPGLDLTGSVLNSDLTTD